MMTNFCAICHGYDEISSSRLLWNKSPEPAGTTRLFKVGSELLVKSPKDSHVYQVCACGRWGYLDHAKLFREIGFDYGSTNSDHVREMYKKLRARFPQAVADFVRGEIKEMVWNNIQAAHRFTWERDLPEDVVRWASQLIEDEVSDSCKDNYRVADKKIQRQVRQYRKAATRGCCGRFDTEAEYRGSVYLVGCNYGH